MTHVALTGTSGAVGGAIKDALLDRGHTVATVGRGDDDIHWDLNEPLSAEAVKTFQSADVVVHAAADINLSSSEAELRRVNLGAVEELVGSLAEAPNPPRLVHVSSAYVESPDGEAPSNGYELTKRAAEEVVLGSPLDVSILRPSLVIGRSTDGAIRRFSGVYIFIRMLRLGLVPAIPGFSQVGVDVVPVDLVAAKALEEVERPAGARPPSGGRHDDDGRIVRITSGSAAPSIEDLVRTACDVFDARTDERVDRPKFVTPDVYHRLFRSMILDKLSPAQKVMLETVEIFLPYFERDHVFESDLVFSRDELLATWKKSVERWLDETSNHSAARGRVVWARRR